MGIRLIVEVLDCYHGPPARKLWLLAFAEKANDRTRQGWPSRETLAWRADVSESRASHIASELVREGVIKRIGGGRKNQGPAQYELLPVIGSQRAPRAHSDSDSQGAGYAHPENVIPTWPQGASPDSQGAFSDSQGARSLPLPAETPGLNPSVRATLSTTSLTRSKDGLPDGRKTAFRASDEPPRSLILRRVFTAAQDAYGDDTAKTLSEEEAAAVWYWAVQNRDVTHPIGYLTKIFRNSLKKDNGATAGLPRLIEKACRWAAGEEDGFDTSRLSELFDQGDLAAVEDELEVMLGYCDIAELSTIDGMIQSGSHPDAVLMKILADREELLMTGRMQLTPPAAAEAYRAGQSVCEIARAYRITRGGAEARIRAGGLGGLGWCPVHGALEELRLANAEAVAYMSAMWGAVAAPEHALGRTVER